MTDRPALAALRLGLEIAGLVAVGRWGWITHPGPLQAVWAVGAPAVLAVVWGVFRVPNDPGPAPVAVPGPVRLAIEFGSFGFAAAALVAVGSPTAAAGFAGAVLVQYAADRGRVRRLLGGRGGRPDL